MLKPLTAPVGATNAANVRLPDLGVVRVAGPDAVKFLQGQVSNDVTKVTSEHAVLAGLHNPQGRVIALLRLMLEGPDDVLAVVPKELAPGVVARLSKFVLRAKAKISDASLEWDVSGVTGVRDGAERRLVLTPAAVPATSVESAAAREAWRALDIADGVPQVYAATSEAFVAQMINLDVLDGIAFDKGCYTGQEVIARAHYRGKVKRRLQRFRTVAPLAAGTSLGPGATGTLHDGRSFKVVDAVTLEDGRCEFLAVAPVSGLEPDDAHESGTSEAALRVEQLSLPYSLPD